MLGAICVTLYNRFEYTKMLFDYLAKNEYVENYPVFISIDHCPFSARLSRLCESYENINIEYLGINNPKLGCGFNQHFIIQKALEKYDYFILFEDDCIPMAKDALNYFHTNIINIGENKFVGGYSRDPYDGSNLYKTRLANFFSVWGWGTSKKLYYETINILYPDGIISFAAGSWDTDLHTRLENKMSILPCVSRIQNVGALDGTHVHSPEWHHEHHYTKEGAWNHELKTQEWGQWRQ